MEGLECKEIDGQDSVGRLSKKSRFLEKIREKTNGLSDVILPSRESNRSPLSSSQHQLWLISCLRQNACRAYHESVAFDIKGKLNLVALRKAYQLLLQRHEILSSVIRIGNDGNPYQLFEPSLSSEMEVLDYTYIKDRDEKRGALSNFLCSFAERDFDFANDRLIRAAVIQMDEDHWSFILVLHHIVTDGWSIGILIRELSQLYNGQVSDRQVVLPILDIQYRDYAAWENSSLDEDANKKDLLFWKNKLEGVPNLDMPTDRIRPHQSSSRGGWVPFEIDCELASALKALSKRARVTSFTLLLSIYKILLFRYTGKTDICVGSPFANRLRPEVENLIGLFVNTVALRTNFNMNDSSLMVIDKVKETATNAFAHQKLSFEKLVSAVNPTRSNQSTSPIFQTLFVFQNSAESKIDLNGVKVEFEYSKNVYSKFDLSFYLHQTSGGGLRCGIEYAGDLFYRETVERLAKHFIELCKAVVTTPERPVYELEFLTEGEKQQNLMQSNITAVRYPKDKCIHELFEAQVEKTPNSVALIFQGEQLTYRELNEQANQVAGALISLGVGPETRVAICIERSLKMQVGLLGILKAGGAYIPLDPAYPKARLDYMMEDSQALVLLTQSGLKKQFLGYKGIVLCIDMQSHIAEQETENPKIRLRSDNLSYVIYTSGSSGKPKGVMVEHRNVVNFLYSMSKQPGLLEQDILCAVTSISFDIHVLELYLPLMHGAKIVIADTKTASNGAALIQLLNEQCATVIQATPATYKLLLQAHWQPFRPMKVLCGGEKLHSEMAIQLLDKGNISLWNMYGPTETTVWSLVEQRSKSTDMSSIGRPIANTQVYILDNNFMLLPHGVPGELYIGGDGVTRGYLNQSELSSIKFISDPFSIVSKQRLYKTGDQCLFLSDGSIKFLGRLDDQIKIRGYRIELGEIESLLHRYPNVTDAVVSVKEGLAGQDLLVAYVVHDLQVGFDQLRTYLSKNLPEYMIPSVFIQLDALPLTPNGKVDRNALPDPTQEITTSSDNYTAPRTELEKQLAQIWSDILKIQIEKISIHDNFFNLGGTSILIFLLIIKAEEKDIFFDAALLHEFPVLSSLAENITI